MGAVRHYETLLFTYKFTSHYDPETNIFSSPPWEPKVFLTLSDLFLYFKISRLNYGLIVLWVDFTETRGWEISAHGTVAASYLSYTNLIVCESNWGDLHASVGIIIL
jgi:hypothetical protein